MPSRTETVRRSQTDAAELAATRRAVLGAIEPAAASSADTLADRRASVRGLLRLSILQCLCRSSKQVLEAACCVRSPPMFRVAILSMGASERERRSAVQCPCPSLVPDRRHQASFVGLQLVPNGGGVGDMEGGEGVVTVATQRRNEDHWPRNHVWSRLVGHANALNFG